MSELIAESFVKPFQGLKQIGLDLTAKALLIPFRDQLLPSYQCIGIDIPRKNDVVLA